MSDLKKGDKVVCVDDRDGTMLPVKAYLKDKKNRKTGKVTKVKVPAVLVKGKTYTVEGVTPPPHDHPDRPLVLLEGMLDEGWWKAWRFQKKGK